MQKSSRVNCWAKRGDIHQARQRESIRSPPTVPALRTSALAPLGREKYLLIMFLNSASLMLGMEGLCECAGSSLFSQTLGGRHTPPDDLLLSVLSDFCLSHFFFPFWLSSLRIKKKRNKKRPKAGLNFLPSICTACLDLPHLCPILTVV